VERFGLKTMTFENRAMALGLAVEHLMTKPAFARLPFGHWSRILVGQIRRGHYFFVIGDKRVVGFCGWALVSEAEAEAWISGSQAAMSATGEAGDFVVVNAWSAETPQAHSVLRDELRIRIAGSKMVYAKREYADGRSRPFRLRLDGSFIAHAEKAKARRPDVSE
jgi:hemolysin-activating ACP:hemolysin acyltransferase